MPAPDIRNTGNRLDRPVYMPDTAASIAAHNSAVVVAGNNHHDH